MSPDAPPPATGFAGLRLDTPRLHLRPLQPADAPALLGIYGDPAFMRFWSSLPWTALAQAEAMIAADLRELPAGEHLRLGVCLRDGGELVGTVSLFALAPSSRRAELGYGIAPAHWRRGYMREAVGAVIDHAFGPMGLNRLEADIDPANTASAAGLRALGFQREGLLRERWIVGGVASDSELWGLLAREWTGGVAR